jgi:hypothetical protein
MSGVNPVGIGLYPPGLPGAGAAPFNPASLTQATITALATALYTDPNDGTLGMFVFRRTFTEAEMLAAVATSGTSGGTTLAITPLAATKISPLWVSLNVVNSGTANFSVAAGIVLRYVGSAVNLVPPMSWISAANPQPAGSWRTSNPALGQIFSDVGGDFAMPVAGIRLCGSSNFGVTRAAGTGSLSANLVLLYNRLPSGGI